MFAKKWFHKVLSLSLALCLVVPATFALAENAKSDFSSESVTVAGTTLQYRLFEPAVSDPCPLVLFLHGEDGCGTDNEAQLTANKGATLWTEPKLAAANPVYVLAPQCPGNDWTTDENVALVKAALDQVITEKNVDTNRIYVVGMSMGGTGVWKMLLTYPDTFAAGMPICGRVPAEYYDQPDAFKALVNMPIWAFHTADDDVIPASETAKAVEALKNAGSKCIKYEEYSAGSITPAHNIWERVFSIGTPYNWLLIQSRARTQNNTVDPSMLFSQMRVNDKIVTVCDYELGKVYVLEGKDSALIIDSAMGGFGAADLYAYIRDNVLVNKDISFDLLLTHNHVDHVLGIPSLMASGKLKHVYIAEADKDGLLDWMTKMNVDLGDKLAFINNGDKFSLDGDDLQAFAVPGHTPGSMVFFFDQYIFTGDAVGSGDLWLTGEYVENYVPSVKSFVDEIAARGGNFELLTGHFENLAPITAQYVQNMLSCAQGIVDGSLPQKVYTRRVGAYATYEDANIFYDATKVKAE